MPTTTTTTTTPVQFDHLTRGQSRNVGILNHFFQSIKCELRIHLLLTAPFLSRTYCSSAIAVYDGVGCLELCRNAEFILPGLELADAVAVAVAAAAHRQRCCGQRLEFSS